jgi:5'-phosphate synthase pdxT subunit
MFKSIGVETVEIRRSADLYGLDGIVLPGGESTAFQIIMNCDDLGANLRHTINAGLPAWGTCAGAIILGKGEGSPQPRWELIDIEVVRNAYGRQIDSFVASLQIEGLGEEFDGVFIRAPLFQNPGKDVEILAMHDNNPVMVKQGNILLTSFHPELTSDHRVHKLFLDELVSK